MSDDVCTDDYDLDVSDHVDAPRSSSESAERLFGGLDGYHRDTIRPMAASSDDR